MIRVSFFSAWRRPQHTICKDEVEAALLIEEGKHQQFAVVVTDSDSDEPDGFERGYDNRSSVDSKVFRQIVLEQEQEN